MNFNLLRWFKKEEPKAPVKGKKMSASRSFKGAIRNRYTDWLTATLTKINADTNQDQLGVITKCRDLAKNDPIGRSYLSICQKNIIGKSGFTLQCQLKDADGKLNEKLNDDIEWMFYDWGKAMNSYLTVDGHTGHNDFDALILRTLLIDGEVFIRIHRGAKNPYGVTFELIDAASIDYTKIREAAPSVNAIILGVEVDKYFKPVAYHYKPGNSTNYQVGLPERIDAKDIIHIFKKEFPQQVRGIPPFNATLDDIKQIQDYRVAELLAAKTAACLGIFYERNSQPVAGDFLNEGEEEDRGTFVQSLEPGMASIAPAGYNVKSVAPTHPNSGYGEFNKSILKQIASSLGVSYAKLVKDYEAVNYSSLREATLDENAYWEEMQAYLIENWKELEFRIFLESIAINTDSFKASQINELLKYHTWICQKRGWFDPSKEILATERSLKLGLKSPIMLMEEQGLDPDEVMKSWALYESLCKAYGLEFNVKGETADDKLAHEDQDYNDENTQTEELETKRD